MGTGIPLNCRGTGSMLWSFVLFVLAATMGLAGSAMAHARCGSRLRSLGPGRLITSIAIAGLLSLGAGLAGTSPANAECRPLSGNTVDCDTCAELGPTGLSPDNDLGGPGGGSTISNQITCRVRQLNPGETITVDVGPGSKVDSDTIFLDFDEQPALVPLTPTSYPPITYLPGETVWGAIRSFQNNSGGVGDATVQASFSRVGGQPQGLNEANVVCQCAGASTQTGTIQVLKQTVDSQGQDVAESGNFGFAIAPTNPNISFDLNTQNNNPQASAQFTVPAGIAYTITETSLPSNDWTLENVSCSINEGQPFEPQISNGGVTLPELNPDDDVQCTFRNRLDEEQDTGTIQVLKRTVDSEGQNVPESGNFGFAITPTNPSVSFNLNTSTNNPQASAQFTVPSGVDYTITETSLPSNDWTLETVFCSTNEGQPVQLPITGTGVTLPELNPEDDVVCTFTNQLRPDEGTVIKIIKRLDPNSDEPTEGTQFNFNVDGSPAATLGIGDEVDIPVDPGQHSVEELTPPANWELTDVDCGDDQNPATVAVEPGETVTCTFTNRLNQPTGSLKIIKTTIGGDDNFRFSVSGQSSFNLRNGQHKKFSTLPVGNYTIREVGLPKGWTLKDISCNERGEKSGNGITVSLDEGDDIVCTFRNFKEEDERMEDLTKLFIHRRVDNLLTYGPDKSRILRRLQEQPIIPLKGGPLKYAEQGDPAALGQGNVQTPYALGYGAAQTPQALGHNPLQMPNAPNVGLYNQGMYGQANSLMPGGASDLAREDALGLAGQQKSTGVLPSLGAQLVPLARGAQSSFKFGTSLSEMTAAAAQADAQAQQRKLNEAGLSFADYPYLNPYSEIRPGFDVWIEGQFIDYDDDTGGISRDGDFSVLYFGADYALAPGVLIGAVFQLDWTDEDINDPTVRGEIDGTGWLAGPYIGLRLTDFLFFDARAAWGTSDNDIWITDEVAGRRSGDFDTDRWLASASLTGTHTFGAWRLSPQIGIDYGSESFDTYRNSLSQIVRGSDAGIGRLRGGAELGYRMQTSGGTIVEPTVSLEGLWNFDDDEFSVDGVPVDFDTGRAKLEGGVIVTTPSGWSFRGAGIYDGIGANDFDAYGGQFWVNIPLQGRQ